jgi:hypothetical protein
MDLMIQLDTLLTDYSLKYFEQVFTENQIYGPMLIWVRNKADILQASAIISNVGDEILLRKFVLFNEADHPEPRAGFYVSILQGFSFNLPGWKRKIQLLVRDGQLR